MRRTCDLTAYRRQSFLKSTGDASNDRSNAFEQSSSSPDYVESSVIERLLSSSVSMATFKQYLSIDYVCSQGLRRSTTAHPRSAEIQRRHQCRHHCAALSAAQQHLAADKGLWEQQPIRHVLESQQFPRESLDHIFQIAEGQFSLQADCFGHLCFIHTASNLHFQCCKIWGHCQPKLLAFHASFLQMHVKFC